MQVKRFVAADMRRALELVRQELGPDAIILSSGRTRDGVELLTTMGSDQVLMELQQQPLDKLGLPLISDGDWAENSPVERAAKKHSIAPTAIRNPGQINESKVGKTGQQLAEEIHQAQLRMMASRKAEASAQEFLVGKNMRVNAGIPRHAAPVNIETHYARQANRETAYAVESPKQTQRESQKETRYAAEARIEARYASPRDEANSKAAMRDKARYALEANNEMRSARDLNNKETRHEAIAKQESPSANAVKEKARYAVEANKKAQMATPQPAAQVPASPETSDAKKTNPRPPSSQVTIPPRRVPVPRPVLVERKPAVVEKPIVVEKPKSAMTAAERYPLIDDEPVELVQAQPSAAELAAIEAELHQSYYDELDKDIESDNAESAGETAAAEVVVQVASEPALAQSEADPVAEESIAATVAVATKTVEPVMAEPMVVEPIVNAPVAAEVVMAKPVIETVAAAVAEAVLAKLIIAETPATFTPEAVTVAPAAAAEVAPVVVAEASIPQQASVQPTLQFSIPQIRDTDISAEPDANANDYEQVPVAVSAAPTMEEVKPQAQDNHEHLLKLQSEIANMRLLLEQQMDRMGEAQAPVQESPVAETINANLEKLGIPEDVASKVVSHCRNTQSVNDAWPEALANLTRQVPVTGRDIADEGGVFAFVGPTGVGKTTTIGKLAARYVLKHGADKVALITTDTYRIAAHDQLRSIARILRVPVRVVDEINTLESLLRNLSHCPLILIDTAGFRHGDPQLKTQLASLAALPQIKTYVVLSTNSQAQMMKASVHAYGAAGLQGCVLTKLDETASLGEAIGVAIRSWLPIAYTTDGQDIPQNIEVAQADKLVEKAVALVNKSPQSAVS